MNAKDHWRRGRRAFSLALAVSLLAGAPIASSEARATEAAAGSESLRAAAGKYGAAWAARDVDQILALHADETEFRLFIHGTAPAIGKEAVRRQFEGVFASNPSYSSTVTDMQYGPNFVYIRYRINMDPKTPTTIGRQVFEAKGESYQVDAMDFIEFENGLVTRKHTFVDTEAIRAASPTAATPKAAE